MIAVADFVATRKLLLRLGAPVPAGFAELDPELGASLCNWIGSDDPSVKWASAPLNKLLRWMQPASVPHDIMWSYLHNDGSRARFDQSNAAFRDTLYLLADASFRWLPILGRRLRAARREEADIAYTVLMSDMCFDVWRKHAEIEPGPERLSDEATRAPAQPRKR